MGVRVRKRDGAWWVSINHRGERKAKKVGDRKSAEEVARKARGALAAGDLQIARADVPLFRDYAEAWLKEYPRVANIKEATAEEYAQHLHLYLLPALGDKPLTGITRAEVKALIARLREAGSFRRPGRGLAPGTVQLVLATLRVMSGCRRG